MSNKRTDKYLANLGREPLGPKLAAEQRRQREAAAAAPKAALASRTNTLFSMPMLYLMGSSAHLSSGSLASSTTAVWVCVAIVAALEANALFGKQGPLTTVRGVIHCSLALTVVLVAILNYL